MTDASRTTLGRTALILSIAMLAMLTSCTTYQRTIVTYPRDDLALPDYGHFRSARCLELVTQLQDLPPDKRVAELAMIAIGNESQYAFALCQMLFLPGRHDEWGPPACGSPRYAVEGDWPLEPITIVDGVPIQIVTGYDLAGQPETPLSFVIGCTQTRSWNPDQYRLRSEREIRAAIESLIARHRDIIGEENEAFLRSQALPE